MCLLTTLMVPEEYPSPHFGFFYAHLFSRLFYAKEPLIWYAPENQCVKGSVILVPLSDPIRRRVFRHDWKEPDACEATFSYVPCEFVFHLWAHLEGITSRITGTGLLGLCETDKPCGRFPVHALVSNCGAPLSIDRQISSKSPLLSSHRLKLLCQTIGRLRC